jgi:hypothetical protein
MRRRLRQPSRKNPVFRMSVRGVGQHTRLRIRSALYEEESEMKMIVSLIAAFVLSIALPVNMAHAEGCGTEGECNDPEETDIENGGNVGTNDPEDVDIDNGGNEGRND